MLNLEPGFDEIVIMLTRWMARLTGRVAGKRRLQIRQVYNLPERWYGNHNLRVIWHRRAHIHSVYVTSHWEWAAIKQPVQCFDGPQGMIISHAMNPAVLPLGHVIAKFFLEFLYSG